METAVQGAFHTDPAIMIAIILKKENWCSEEHRYVKDGKLGIYDAYLSAAMPAAFMTLQAQACGINSCILTPEFRQTAQLLKIPKGNAIPMILGFGYEKKGAYQKERNRYPLQKIVSYEIFEPKKIKKTLKN